MAGVIFKGMEVQEIAETLSAAKTPKKSLSGVLPLGESCMKEKLSAGYREKRRKNISKKTCEAGRKRSDTITIKSKKVPTGTCQEPAIYGWQDTVTYSEI